MFAIRRPHVFGTLAGSDRLSRRRWIPLLALCAGLAATLPAHGADALPATDRQAIERAIRDQLDAFGRDDADGAFAIATPEIQRQFGTSDRFLATVREDYEPVYRPAHVLFLKLEHTNGEWVQSVRITDADGRVWQVLYTMRRQTDRRWKIGGCRLVETDARST
jgi:hypothetical protein